VRIRVFTSRQIPCRQMGNSSLPTPDSGCSANATHQVGATPAFTLVELLVSMSVLVMILFVLLSITNSTQRIWKQTSTRIDSFRAARIGFESVSRRLSQATLNTYWDYNNPTSPTSYVRCSELRFISGGSNLSGTVAGGTPVTHSIFFQAPLGYVSDSTYNRMENLLNTCGYYVVLASDTTTRPSFLTLPAHTRFRLMELSEPAESLSIYTYTSGSAGYTGNAWFSTPLGVSGNSHVIADNVIALVLLPKLSGNSGASLTSNYTYSSAPVNYPYVTGTQTANENQLPPLVQVTMVAIDEVSAARLETISNGDQIAELGLASLFQTVGSLTDPTVVPGYANDLQTLTNKLQSLHLNYRVFNTEVSIRGAKWGGL